MTPGQTDNGPTLAWLAGKMAKRAVQKPRRIPHLLLVLLGAARSRWRMRAAGAGGKQSTLIAMIEHLGDVIAAEPVARYAARHFPGGQIAWICRAPYRLAVQGFPAVDAIITVRCITEWHLLWATEKRGNRVWDLHISGRGCAGCGFNYTKPDGAGEITYDTYFAIGNLLKVNCLVAGLPVLDEAPRVMPDDAASAIADRLGLPERFVIIHCKSNEGRKDWETHKWRELIEWFTNEIGLSVFEVGNDAVVITEDTMGTRNLCGHLAVLETAAVMARATLFIGIDSGPAHLANATGVPGVILLGRYHLFDRYTPYSGGYGDGSLAELVRSPGLAREIPVAAVVAAAARRLGMRATGQHVSQGSDNI